jgi:hypothetical protein
LQNKRILFLWSSEHLLNYNLWKFEFHDDWRNLGKIEYWCLTSHQAPALSSQVLQLNGKQWADSEWYLQMCGKKCYFCTLSWQGAISKIHTWWKHC